MTDLHLKHMRALSAVRSDVAREREAPHAHINWIRGQRNKFGQSRKHLKTYKTSKKSIHTRAMVNITSDLLAKPEFGHVKQLRLKLREIQQHKGYTFDNGEPATLKLG